MSQAHDPSQGGKDPMWVVLIEGILQERDAGYTSFHDIAWAISEGMEDFQYTISCCPHRTIARAFVIQQKEQAKVHSDT